MKTKSLIERMVRLTVFCFPAVVVTVPHGSTAAYFLLAAFGLVFGFRGWKSTTGCDRAFIYGILILLASVTISLFQSDDFSRGLSKFERYLRLPLFIPFFLLLVSSPSFRRQTHYLYGLLAAAPITFLYAGYQTLIPIILFSAPLDLAPDSSATSISTELHQEFERQGYPLTAAHTLSHHEGSIILRDNNQRCVWLIATDSTLDVRGPRLLRAKGATHSIIFGDFCMFIAVVIAAWLISCASGRWQYLLGTACIVLATYASALSGTRGAWISIPATSLFLLTAYHRRIRRNQVLCFLAIVAIACLLLLVLPIPKSVSTRAEHGIGGLLDPSQYLTTHERLQMWRAATDIFADSPFWGSGLGDYSLDLQRLINEGRSDLRHAYDHAHSIYFDSLARTGLIGTLTMLVTLFIIPFLIFLRSWQNSEHPHQEFASVAGMLTVISFACFGLTEAWFSRMPLITTYVVSIFIFLAQAGNAPPGEHNLDVATSSPTTPSKSSTNLTRASAANSVTTRKSLL